MGTHGKQKLTALLTFRGISRVLTFLQMPPAKGHMPSVMPGRQEQR